MKKITKVNKRHIARQIKNVLNREYLELAIMYNPFHKSYFVCETSEVENYINVGHKFYSIFQHYDEGCLTLQQIEENIFKEE